MSKTQKGFSLIELLIVVAIILVIAAIAIPNLIRAKISADEAVAAASIHAINSSEIQYSTMYPTVGYSVLLADLGPAGAGLIDAVLASGTKKGYVFTYAQGAGAPAAAYTVNADPVVRSVTGQRSFFSNETDVTRYDPGVPATVGSSPL